jgi:hypothetical protein
MPVHAATLPSTEFQLTSADGLQIACALWDSRRPVRGVVQIATVWVSISGGTSV